MKEFNQDKVTDRFAKLPDATKEIILSDAFRSTFKSVLEGARLSENKETELNQQATLVLVGFATKQDFTNYIENELQTEKSTPQILLKEFEEHIFAPIRNSLLEEFGKRERSERKTEGDKMYTGTGDPYREPIK